MRGRLAGVCAAETAADMAKDRGDARMAALRNT